jgi:diguanylate cyclase (GGDEF)-like protein
VTTTTVLIGALVAALLLAAAAVIALVRARAAADERVAEAVRRLAEGMQETMRDLAAAYEEARAPSGGTRHAGELAASLDLDEVAERTLAAAGSLPGVDAALIEVEGSDGHNVTATLGAQPDEAERAALRAPSDENLRALEVAYRYRLDDVDAASGALRSGVVVPIRAESGRVGTLGAFTRSATHRFGDDTVEELERLAFRAGPALENARHYAEARQLADLDALTGLHNRRYFHETLGRECARAKRYERKLALIVFDLDDFKAINNRIGHLAGDAVLAELAERVRAVVRSADIACRVGGDEFAVILPECGRRDAELLAERIARAITSRPLATAGTMYISAGIAELRREDGAKELFERADGALYRAKDAGKAQTYAANDA